MEALSPKQMRLKALSDQQKLLQKHEVDLRHIQQKQQATMELMLKELYCGSDIEASALTIMQSLQDQVEIDDLPTSSSSSTSIDDVVPRSATFEQPSDILDTPQRNSVSISHNVNGGQELKEDISTLTRAVTRKRSAQQNSHERDSGEDTVHVADPGSISYAAGPRKRFRDSEVSRSVHKKPAGAHSIIETPFKPQNVYPRVSKRPEYSFIVYAHGRAIELQCNTCKGNRGRHRPVVGVNGMQRHITRCHGKSYSYERVIQTCVKKVLTTEEANKVKKGEYRVKHARSASSDGRPKRILRRKHLKKGVQYCDDDEDDSE